MKWVKSGNIYTVPGNGNIQIEIATNRGKRAYIAQRVFNNKSETSFFKSLAEAKAYCECLWLVYFNPTAGHNGSEPKFVKGFKTQKEAVDYVKYMNSNRDFSKDGTYFC